MFIERIDCRSFINCSFITTLGKASLDSSTLVLFPFSHILMLVLENQGVYPLLREEINDINKHL
jgi:hypothetical protein